MSLSGQWLCDQLDHCLIEVIICTKSGGGRCISSDENRCQSERTLRNSCIWHWELMSRNSLSSVLKTTLEGSDIWVQNFQICLPSPRSIGCWKKWKRSSRLTNCARNYRLSSGRTHVGVAASGPRLGLMQCQGSRTHLSSHVWFPKVLRFRRNLQWPANLVLVGEGVPHKSCGKKASRVRKVLSTENWSMKMSRFLSADMPPPPTHWPHTKYGGRLSFSQACVIYSVRKGWGSVV